MCEAARSLWFKACPGFRLSRWDTIYTGSCPAGNEWAWKHQWVFHPKSQEKRERCGGRACCFFKLLLTKNSGMGESLHKFQAVSNDRMFPFSSAIFPGGFGDNAEMRFFFLLSFLFLAVVYEERLSVFSHTPGYSGSSILLCQLKLWSTHRFKDTQANPWLVWKWMWLGPLPFAYQTCLISVSINVCTLPQTTWHNNTSRLTVYTVFVLLCRLYSSLHEINNKTRGRYRRLLIGCLNGWLHIIAETPGE